MDKERKKEIQEMLYDKSTEEILKDIDNINDSETLYVYAYNYNWDNGFEIPQKIINKKCCDLSTALMIFYRSDGVRYLQEKNSENINLNNWSKFMKDLYAAIISRKFKKSTIKFELPLSKVQLFKLKKSININENVFIEEMGTQDLNIILWVYYE